jgi:hypothetical protein
MPYPYAEKRFLAEGLRLLEGAPRHDATGEEALTDETVLPRGKGVSADVHPVPRGPNQGR